MTDTTLPTELALDVRILLPLLTDPTAPWPDRYLITHVGRWERGQTDVSKFNRCTVRNDRFRFVNKSGIFDVHSDPGESKNVIAEHPR